MILSNQASTCMWILDLGLSSSQYRSFHLSCFVVLLPYDDKLKVLGSPSLLHGWPIYLTGLATSESHRTFGVISQWIRSGGESIYKNYRLPKSFIGSIVETIRDFSLPFPSPTNSLLGFVFQLYPEDSSEDRDLESFNLMIFLNKSCAPKELEQIITLLKLDAFTAEELVTQGVTQQFLIN